VSAGSIHKGVRIGVLNTFKLPFLNSDLVSKFTDIVKPMLKKQYEIEQENLQLVELRDWLLPMLMNGQVKVE
jgi:type I restriction enzyme S subunit